MEVQVQKPRACRPVDKISEDKEQLLLIQDSTAPGNWLRTSGSLHIDIPSRIKIGGINVVALPLEQQR